MILLLFDQMERRIADVEHITSCTHTDDESGNTLSVVGYGIPKEAAYCAFKDHAGDLQLFHIQQHDINPFTGEITLYAENAYYELLTEAPLEDVRPTTMTAPLAVAQAINNTRWTLGTSSAGTLTASARWYYITRTEALSDIAEKWGVRYKFRIEVSASAITGRYIDVMPAAPVWRGKRYEIGKDILDAKYTIDKRNVVTAIIGRGKGEETGDGYGRRIDFSEVVWTVAGGDPADKPSGQKYVEIPSATALYGVMGVRPLFTTKEYGDIDDAEQLLQATYNDLLAACEPTVSATLTVFDLERMGFPHEAARRGDEVALIVEGLRARATVVGIKREYAAGGKDVVQLGDAKSSLVKAVTTMKRDLRTTDTKAQAGAAIAQKNTSLLQGYIDTMVTKIQSSGTKMSTDPIDGGLVFENTAGTRAVKITGIGILIASSKTAGAWNWTTAIDGAGMVADAITTGVLRTSLIQILGTTHFYWDTSNIYIIDPDDSNTQIRIGLYDGTNYGIGYTSDGGTTWQTAIGFNGIVLGVGSVTADMLSTELEGRITSFVTRSEYSQGMTLKADESELAGLATTADVESLYQSYQTQTAQTITNKFNETQTYTVAVDGRLEEFKTFVESYQRFSAAGLELGASNSAFKALLSNTRLSFTQNGTEIAYISNNKMYITDAEITNRLTIGNFDLYKMGDGSLAFKWHSASAT